MGSIVQPLMQGSFEAWALGKGYGLKHGAGIVLATCKEHRLEIEYSKHLVSIRKMNSLRNSYCCLSFQNIEQLDNQLDLVKQTIKIENDTHS